MRWILILITISSLLVAAHSGLAQSKDNAEQAETRDGCKPWRAMADPQVHSSSTRPEVEHLTEAEASVGISCLLKLEGNHRPGSFSGATRFDVSQLFPEATVELDALYVISAIYYQRWGHADGIALVDGESQILGPQAGAKAAFPCVKKWYSHVKNDGLQKLRADESDPLKGSGVKWY